MKCTKCDGSGKRPMLESLVDCWDCGGTGGVEVTVTVEPAGPKYGAVQRPIRSASDLPNCRCFPPPKDLVKRVLADIDRINMASTYPALQSATVHYVMSVALMAQDREAFVKPSDKSLIDEVEKLLKSRLNIYEHLVGERGTRAAMAHKGKPGHPSESELMVIGGRGRGKTLAGKEELDKLVDRCADVPEQGPGEKLDISPSMVAKHVDMALNLLERSAVGEYVVDEMEFLFFGSALPKPVAGPCPMPALEARAAWNEQVRRIREERNRSTGWASIVSQIQTPSDWVATQATWNMTAALAALFRRKLPAPYKLRANGIVGLIEIAIPSDSDGSEMNVEDDPVMAICVRCKSLFKPGLLLDKICDDCVKRGVVRRDG